MILRVAMTRVLLLLPKTTYRSHAFIQAATELGFDLVVGSDHRATLAPLTPGKTLVLKFGDPQSCADTIERLAQASPFDAILGVDDDTVIPAAYAARALGLHHNPIPGLEATRNKHLMRQRLAETTLRIPWFSLFRTTDDPGEIGRLVRFPCVLKPTFLSASQGVIRANTLEEFVRAFETICKILSDPENMKKGGPYAEEVLVEAYLPGREFALEGLLHDGTLRPLAIFDKPDPLEGPYFVETLYTVPSRLPNNQQDAIVKTVQLAVDALDLTDGPIHAEVRLDGDRVQLVEIAARPIGGLCSRVLKFKDSLSLEVLLLKNAVGDPVADISREEAAAGVMMMPVTSTGRFQAVNRLEEARNLPGIEEIVISIPPGQILEPLPHGARYFGFIFARDPSSSVVESAIRKAYSTLELHIEGI